MICCVTGHRPAGFPFPHENTDSQYREYCSKLSNEIEKLILEGYHTFITGMADGADIDFAEKVIRYREIFDDIMLVAAMPYPSQPVKHMTQDHMKRLAILESCDIKHVISDHYFRGCMDKRNRFMVDRADLVLAIWNGVESGGTWNTIKYARSKGKPIRYLMLNELM